MPDIDGIERPNGSRKAILVLEDEPFVMNVFRFALGSKGYTVIEASSAKQAHEQFRQHAGEVDLVITDPGLPDGSGVAVALALWLELPALRIIVTSGLPPSMWRDPDASAFEELPPDTAVLLKPFFPAKLIELVESTIGHTERSERPGDIGPVGSFPRTTAS